MAFSNFFGKQYESASNFLDDLEMAFLVSGRDEEEVKLRAFPLVLKDSAKNWFQNLEPGRKTNWETLKETFLSKYGGLDNPEHLWHRISSLHQATSRTYLTYESQFLRLWAEWEASLAEGERAPNFLKKEKFLAGLFPDLQEKVKGKFPETFEEALQIARVKDRKLEYQAHTSRVEHPQGPTMADERLPPAPTTTPEDPHLELLQRVTNQLDNLSINMVQGVRQQQPQPNNERMPNGQRRQPQRRDYFCYNCGEEGHEIKEASDFSRSQACLEMPICMSRNAYLPIPECLSAYLGMLRLQDEITCTWFIKAQAVEKGTMFDSELELQDQTPPTNQLVTQSSPSKVEVKVKAAPGTLECIASNLKQSAKSLKALEYPRLSKFFFLAKELHEKYGLNLEGKLPKELSDKDIPDEEWLSVFKFMHMKNTKLFLNHVRDEFVDECRLLYQKVYQATPSNGELLAKFARGFVYERCPTAASDPIGHRIAWARFGGSVLENSKMQKGGLERKNNKFRTDYGLTGVIQIETSIYDGALSSISTMLTSKLQPCQAVEMSMYIQQVLSMADGLSDQENELKRLLGEMKL
ncbi:hypothetical protein L7F22_029062 [Adiantum nelumboides]|nr:hypothetical protein [Adiantum nelumboides]